MDDPSLEVFKARLDGSFGNLSCCVAALPMAGGWNWMIFDVPSNSSHFVSMKWETGVWGWGKLRELEPLCSLAGEELPQGETKTWPSQPETQH